MISKGVAFDIWYAILLPSPDISLKIMGLHSVPQLKKFLGLEGGSTPEFKTLSLSLGQKGYNSLAF